MGTASQTSPVKSGVPQGTVLGPILFLIFISSIDEDIRYSFLSSFADDTRICKGVSNAIDTFKLQRDLNVTYQWTESNNMTLNDTKFQLLRHGQDRDIIESSCYLSPSAKRIENKDCVKDLGVYMDSKCSFTPHISHVVDKVKETSGWMWRTFKLSVD